MRLCKYIQCFLRNLIKCNAVIEWVGFNNKINTTIHYQLFLNVVAVSLLVNGHNMNRVFVIICQI